MRKHRKYQTASIYALLVSNVTPENPAKKFLAKN